MIGEQHGHAALALARQYEERLLLDARHQHIAAACGCLDETKPAAPGRLLVAFAGEIAGDRMALAAIGNFGAEAAFENTSARRGREHRSQGRIVEAVDDRNGMVVLLGDLARERVGDDLGDVLAAMIDHYRQGYALAGVDFEPLRLAIAHMDIDADRRAATACILDPEAQRLLLADDAEARRLLKYYS